jgi:hypothetical protein
MKKDTQGTKICTCNFWTGAKTTPELLENMSTLGDGAYQAAWSSGRMNALRFGFRYQMLMSQSSSSLADLTTDVIEITRELRYHPAVVGGLGFLFDNQFTMPVLHLLSDIYDIERFRKPGHPSSISYLKNYFRVVTSKAIHKHLQGDNYDGPVAAIPRSVVALSSWYTHPFVKFNSCGYLFCLYEKWVNHFLSRGRTTDEAAADAAWRTTIKVLQFLFWTWVTPLQDSQTLDARRFFSDDPDTAEKFISYMYHTNLDNVKLVFGPFG